MSTVFLMAVIFIIALAILDLWVGVTNDAVNFVNSAVGARIASRRTIFIIVSFGVVIGALISSGMMEVARKGVFDPGFFYDAEGKLNVNAILCIYLGVMAADIITLDLFNTLGLPTSTTVSIVSELAGASLAMGVWMSGDVGDVIKTGPLLDIYIGIFASILVAFIGAAIVMFLLRLIFSHDLAKSFPAYGWLWTGISFCALSYFVLFKGLKNAPFLSDETNAWLHAHIYTVMGGVFIVSALVAIIFAKHHRIIFKAIILTGTCSLAIAFAGNDLVNFIGPSVAAAQAVFIEGVDLSGKVKTPGWALFAAGAIMVFALWRSKKAKSVTDTEVRLASGGSLEQNYSAANWAKAIIKIILKLYSLAIYLIPRGFRQLAERRTNGKQHNRADAPPYDLLRASVNLTIASIIISSGTALKLPLSTTYITFMVAIGASLADRAWEEGTAASRVKGMLTVIGGWLVTGFLAAGVAFLITTLLYHIGLGPGMLIVAITIALWLIKSAASHKRNLGTRETVTDQLEAA